MLQFIKNNKRIFWFLGFLLGGCYLLVRYLPLSFHRVHTPLDDFLPFLPIFILPYYIWYIYVPVPLIVSCFATPKAFVQQAISLFSGMALCCIIFVIYPTCVDFRPTAEGDGILLWLCRVIYASDPPHNVFPSLHCYESTAIHLSVFVYGPWKEKKVLRAVSAVIAVLICLSAVFVKQHAVPDLAAGCGLAWFICYVVHIIFERRNTRDHSAL